MSELGLLLRHFSDAATAALSSADRFAQDAKARELGTEHLLLAIIHAGKVGARALAEAGISPDSLTQIVHDAPRRKRQSRPNRSASNSASQLLNRQLNSPFNRLMNLLFSRVRHPPHSDDFEHAVIRAFRIAQQRPDRTADTGDLLLGVLDVLSRLSPRTDLAGAGVEPDMLIGKIEQERRRQPETQRYTDPGSNTDPPPPPATAG